MSSPSSSGGGGGGLGYPNDNYNRSQHHIYNANSSNSNTSNAATNATVATANAASYVPLEELLQSNINNNNNNTLAAMTTGIIDPFASTSASSSSASSGLVITTTASAATTSTQQQQQQQQQQQHHHYDEMAAANAEAMRMAVELGVASSVRNTRKRGTFRQLISPGAIQAQQQLMTMNAMSPRSSTTSNNNNNNNNYSNTTQLLLHQQQQMLEGGAFSPVPSDVLSNSGVGLNIINSNNGLLSQYQINQQQLLQQMQQQQQQQQVGGASSGSGDAMGSGGMIPRLPSSATSAASVSQASQPYLPPSVTFRTGTPSVQLAASYAASEGSQSLHIFDCHGQRTPYREGPYFVHHQKDGRRIKKRWYGRLEDGYLAWSSIYLHEFFGFTIYTPLTPEEQQSMKDGGRVPKWMNEFSSLPNLAIPLSYFCIGVALQLLRTPLIVYFIEDLGATAAEVNVLFTVMAVPWCFKVLYGFLSDCVPISGLRRKPYFMTGWLIYILSNLILMISPIPSIQLCILLVFTQTAGYMLADVMTDALIVERSRYETQETRGTMQSQGYIIRFFGSTIGAAIGAVVYNKDSWGWYLPMRLVFFINAAFPLIFLLPVVPFLLELETSCVPKNFYSQCHELFETAQLRSVWQPMTFVYIYNALQLTNAAWMNFLVEGLDFTAWQIGIVSIFGSVMAWFGIMTYKRFFFASNWRIVYFWCTTLASIIALGQLILVFGLNKSIGLRLGLPGFLPTRKIEIPDIWFSMGDDVLVEFVIAVQFLPMCIMYLGLCPEGSEGTTYAMLTTWSNLAGSLAFDISTALTAFFDVSSPTIESGNYSGVWKLSLLSGLMGPLPLLLLGLIPKNKEDQRRLQADQTRHYWAGVLFIFVMVATLIITFAESVYEVYFKNEEESLNSSKL